MLKTRYLDANKTLFPAAKAPQIDLRMTFGSCADVAMTINSDRGYIDVTLRISFASDHDYSRERIG